ncbi:MAG: hypothetical protein IPL60_11530 [Ardenticatenia bacterium]|nr:hypothetical protein [Ardenticatenia bacterium]
MELLGGPAASPSPAASSVPSASASPTAVEHPEPTPSPSSPPPFVPAAEFFVAAAASGSGDGSLERPWTLQQALSQPASLKAGGLVWLRGGTYAATWKTDPSLGRISFSCGTHGTAEAPIVFRNYRDERVTIDGEANEVVLFAQDCSFTWFWGLELMSSAPVRTPSRSYIYGTAPDLKFINMFLHDMADGIDLWTTATNAELYGSLVYHNGWDETNGATGTASTPRTRRASSVSRTTSSSASTATTSRSGPPTSSSTISCWRATSSSTAARSEYASRKFNFFVVGNNPSAPARNLVVRNNYTFAGNTTTTPACNAFGPNYGATDLILEDNYLLGQFRVGGPYVNCSIRRNHILGGTALGFITGTGFDRADYPDNVYAQEPPTSGAEVFVPPNVYEPGRANVAIYNWGGADTVDVAADTLGLATGDRYQLIHAMDFYKDIITRSHDGGGRSWCR